MPGVEEIELVIPPLRDLPQPAELSADDADDADDADKNLTGPPDLNSVNSPRL